MSISIPPGAGAYQPEPCTDWQPPRDMRLVRPWHVHADRIETTITFIIAAIAIAALAVWAP